MSEDDWNFDYPKIARDSGFKFFQHNDGNIDWRQLGGIEVEKIIQNQNIEKLDGIIIHLAEVPLGPLLNSNVLESGVAKFFLLSQLAIQYLIFCKRFLDETVTSMRSRLKDLQTENTRLKKLEQENADDVLQLHKELQKLRNINEVIFPCSMCTKNFVSNEMLNVHISRKHSNEIQSTNTNIIEKRTEKQNDKQLISTIKLELEIKHLKERLNDAEKVIRNQTFEISKQIEEIKGTPRHLQSPQKIEEKEKLTPTITVGTQNIISVKNIGIQSNLVEDKEKDDIDTMEKNNILEIFKKINEKINEIEKFRDDDLKNREATLQKFENKLQNVTEAIEAKQLHNLEVLNSFTDKMSSQTSLNADINLDELKDFLSDAMEKIQNENKRQLHQIAEKFDQTYLDKLNNLKMKIDKISSTDIKESKESPSDLKTIINQSKEIAQRFTSRSEKEKLIPPEGLDISKTKQPVINVKQKCQKPIIPKSQFYSRKDEAISSELSESSEISDETETESSESISYAGKKNNDKTKPIFKTRSFDKVNLPESNNLVKEKDGNLLKNKKTMKFKEKQRIIVPPLKLKHLENNTPKLVRKMQETRLKSIGISPNAKSIATSSMLQIYEDLANIRNDKKRLFPKFNTTRNHLKTLVDKMIWSKDETQAKVIKSTSSKSNNQSNLNKMEEPLRRKLNAIKSESETESLTSSKSTFDKAENKEVCASAPKQTKDEFKLKLEKILSSPMHKLKKTSLIESPAFKVPVPTPRKKVMFDFPMITTKEEDSSLISDDDDKKKENTGTSNF